MCQLTEIATEQANERSAHIDQLETLDILRLINDEDAKVAGAVRAVLPAIEEAIERIHTRMQQGGRLIYIGSGTSGRLGVLDAAECPPTFGTDPDEIVAIIAGGKRAMTFAIEGAEDSPEQGARDLAAIKLKPEDSVIGIAASGRTPYVIGALEYAQKCGALTIALTCSNGSAVSRSAEITIMPQPGPEIITGSTRMKSGTAQKMVLNMISTTLMIKQGKVYGNLMVDVKASNQKLVRRAIHIVRTVTGVSEQEAMALLEKADYHAKTAIVMHWLELDAQDARARLNDVDGQLSQLVPKTGKLSRS